MRSLVWLICVLFFLSACGSASQPSASQNQPSDQEAAQAAPTSEALAAPSEVAAEPTEPPPTAEAIAEPTTEPTSAPAASDEDLSELIMNSFRAYTKAGPFHTKLDMESDGKLNQVESYVILPNKIHTFVHNDDIQSEMIVIDDTMWIKMGESWIEAPGAGQIGPMIEEIAQDPASIGVTLSNTKHLGSEDIDGVSADLYSYTSSYDSDGKTYVTDAKVWIAKDSGLPIRQESESNIDGKITKMVQTITYDPNITIEPPQ